MFSNEKVVIEADRLERHYWADLWRYRELLYILAWRDVLVRYKQTIIGVAWAVLRPAVTMVVFVGFRRIARLDAGGAPDPILVLTAILPWQLFSSALSDCSTSLIGNVNLITKIYFPRLIIPLAAVLTSLVDFLITAGLLAVLMAWYGISPGWQLVCLPIFILLNIGLSTALGILVAALNVEYRDFRYIVPFIVQFGLFISPIAFATSNVPEQWRSLYAVNPLVGIIDGFRWSVLGGLAPFDPRSIQLSMLVTTLLLVLGLAYFRRAERRFADLI